MPITVLLASDLLGISKSTAYHLVDTKVLKTYRIGKWFRYVPNQALEQFAQSPRCWLYVAPSDIPDPRLRMLACSAREHTPGQWYSTAMLAHHYQVCSDAILKWREKYDWACDAQWARYGHSYYAWFNVLPDRPTPEIVDPQTIDRTARALRQREASA